jgi:hypothetical protein
VLKGDEGDGWEQPFPHYYTWLPHPSNDDRFLYKRNINFTTEIDFLFGNPGEEDLKRLVAKHIP